ncbi:hypothetical protein TREMEDRAFT_71742 [Tremella mesenterica DSM 1558]|uniref:uncharacterized protein n=1 Tax=Tremella mesenterica (strain ATCC 24925 / CBS 8224 / DSM 1558 / NBRC 9311 / NRRL Y-6157 / RJB 2259-6 / UBC 559-6) TaxID=578456 RepID=UPI0003F4994B|nr:uncharacterized protein TREMEDRAFT_71742 [Tremella mesenterica DSM 1558]EIW68970.1 hypothetical protein TREMEDRAFT_71742 [Tremella mesenterica DSM 1558]
MSWAFSTWLEVEGDCKEHGELTTRPKPKSSLTIVIKLGTSSIVSPAYPFLPHLQLLSSIVETCVNLRELGHKVVICSSGAIGVGLRRMGLKERGKLLSQKQALAAVGQGRLIALWDNLFSQLDQPIAQILLTRTDISDRTRYLNAQNTFNELLAMGVLPIVNENDTVSVSEIKFGDNDTLSAITSGIVHADYLFLLTDVDCLYTDNPRHNPDAKPVRVVRDIEKIKEQVSVKTLGTSLGTGGMSTKLIAAELATAAGTTAVIMNSNKVSDIFGVIENGVGPSREEADTPGLDEGPLCTRFLRREVALKDRKWWITHGLHAAGTVVIDEGALRAISRKESGGRLLPAGVVRVEGGPFASHQAVRIVVRRRRRPRSITVEPPTRSSLDGSPDTPSRMITPASPSSSSPSSITRHIHHLLDPLTVSASESGSISITGDHPIPDTPTLRPIANAMSVPFAGFGALGEGKDDEWEEVEVGKGLAQYNSVEIDRIKGLKSSHIEHVLGYSESEHVVDSITIF